VLQAGLAANPGNYQLAVDYGRVLVSLGKEDLALEVLSRAREIIDWDPELWNNLGVIYWNRGELEEAIKMYEHSLRLFPKNPVALANLGATETSLALKNKDNGWLIKAEEHFKKAIDYDAGQVAAYNGLGAVYRLTGRLDVAISYWQKAVELDPDHQQALFNLGTAYFDQGDKNQALIYLSRYKKLYYQTLPEGEKAELDFLIEKCR